HMPLHLGSMGESVKTVIRLNAGNMRPGNVYVLNAPYNGGTHLPDVTVITPVFDSRQILFYVGSRGHHADIGGITPGSMPPESKLVEEEGVLIDNFLLVEQGRFREKETVALLTSGKYPVRNVEQNVADLRAQVAANEKGVQELRRMVEHFGLDVVRAYMRHVPDNFNAPAAVCMAAVLYVFRTLVEDDIPLNAGCLKPLEVRIPEGCMLRPRYPAAVVAGNVETSQCITDALYGALGVLAASQGTMNNFTFGNERYQYYETVAGGSGAGPGFDGADVVRPHGLAGGEPGMPGRNYVIRAGGRRDELGPFAQTEMAAGDVFVIETPGGGGYGPAAEYNRT